MSERNLLREQKANTVQSDIDYFVLNPCKKNILALDQAINELKRTYPQCELADKYHGKDCRVSIDDLIYFDARIVRDGIWAAIEFRGAQVTYSWEAVDEVMTNGGVFEI